MSDNNNQQQQQLQINNNDNSPQQNIGIFGQTPFCENELNMISEKLAKSIPDEDISSRLGPGGQNLAYIEGWKLFNITHGIFGFNGWSSSINELSVDIDEQIGGGADTRPSYKVGVSAIVQVTLKDGTSHQDVGFGFAEMSSRGLAFEKAKKEAVTDARKRALRLFGDALGNFLADREVNKELGISRKNAKKPPKQQPQQQQQQQQQQQPQQHFNKPPAPLQQQQHPQQQNQNQNNNNNNNKPRLGFPNQNQNQQQQQQQQPSSFQTQSHQDPLYNNFSS
eukprot:gene5528-6886_t